MGQTESVETWSFSAIKVSFALLSSCGSGGCGGQRDSRSTFYSTERLSSNLAAPEHDSC